MTIEDFIKKNSEYFDAYKYCFEWNGFKVYDVWAKADEDVCIGYPQYALERNGKTRESTHEETIKIMDFEYPPNMTDE